MKNLKKALKTVIETSEVTLESLADGKISIWEGLKISKKAIGFISAVKNFPEIKKEYLGLSDAQKVELVEWFTEEFDIADDKVEEIVEMIFEALLRLSDLFDKIEESVV